jgi:hypothetical protein
MEASPQKNETGQLARFRDRRLQCGYIAARRGWLGDLLRARFASACASRANQGFKRSEDTTVSEGATVGPVSDSAPLFQLSM